MAKKSESYGWIPFWSHINFSNWAAQLCGISREALQLSTFGSAVLRYPPPFPQALAEETLETWISEPQTPPPGKKRHIYMAIPSPSPIPAGSGAPPGAGDAHSSKALGTAQPLCCSPALPSWVGPKLIQAEAPRGCNCNSKHGIETVS